METIITTSSSTGARTTFDDQLRDLHRLLEGQLLIAQDRCVDALLDLYNAAPNRAICELLGEMMSDIRYVSAVRVQLLRDDLTLMMSYR